MDDYHPDQASTSGEEGPEFVWARVSPEDLAWVKTLEVRSGFPKRSRQRDLSPVQSDKTVVTVSEFARLLHVFAHMVERSAQSEDAPAPKAVRVRKVKAMTEPASPPG